MPSGPRLLLDNACYHIITREIKGNGFFRRGKTIKNMRSYTAYFNGKYGKVGHLWQGRFKSKVITKDRYLFDCINYIEANPVRANLVNSIQEYKWSSYIERTLEENKDKPLVNNLIL